MSESFFLHVGSMKSGTTTVQAIAEASEERLAADGVGFPFGVPSDANRRRFMLRLGRMQDGPTKRAKMIARLRNGLRQTPQRVAFFSAERLAELSSETISGIAEAARETDLQVIVTLRDLARQVPSHWQQASKVANLPSYPTYCEQLLDPTSETFRAFMARYDATDIAERWGGLLGPDKVHLVVLPQRGGDDSWLPHAFFQLLGVDAANLDLTKPHLNQSMGYTEAEFVRHIIEDIREKGAYKTHEILAVVRERLTPTEAGAGDRIGVPEATLEWCRAQADRQIREIVAAGWQVTGDLEDLRPSPDTELFVPRAERARELDIATEYLERFLQTEIDANRARRREERAIRKQERIARRQELAAASKPSVSRRARSLAGRLAGKALPRR